MPSATYIIASTPRSGSTLLCDGLFATGVAGRPTETLAPHFRSFWLDQWSLPADSGFGEYFQAALNYGTTPNGIYGTKIHWEHLPALARELAVEGRPDQALTAAFPGAAYVRLIRNDLRAQALSLFRATVTDQWCRWEGQPPSPADDPVLDEDVVRGFEAAIVEQRAAWDGFFAAHRIRPLTVEYEDLDADYRGQIARVLNFLGLDGGAAYAIPGTRLLRQSDELTAAWREAMDARDTPSDEQVKGSA
ncbi:Stf0 family sulfotransferase [Hamadaea tsunoensis]|uniref:Stf0 family sulfotransferase n=1 Tax=Hamadaea tsunoensis TaxID=53368 RepID=UPI0003FC04DC|nr:Stf0 family sulfotransferase [Hamadaea tsunoensis]